MLTCPFCKSTADEAPTQRDATRYDCPRCGAYDLTSSAQAVLAAADWTARQFANASAWLRENQGTLVADRHLVFLKSLHTPTVQERATKILIEMDRSASDIGEEFSFNFSEPRITGRWLSVSWSENHNELRYLFCSYLVNRGFIDGEQRQGGWDFNNVVITPNGHDQLEKLREGGAGSVIGFCAMWFEPKLASIWTEAIKPAIEGAGYRAERIDNVQHNNKIDDEIVAMIRKSRFVVADFTGNRGGVYFEAGFARGLAIPVIWTIRDGRFHRVHFDNRQYNFIGRDATDLPDFRVKLQNRIEATLGRGPL